MQFTAPWGRQVKLVTLFIGGLLLVVGLAPWIFAGDAAAVPGSIAALSTLGVLAGSAVWGVRGYDVRPDVIAVRRLGWTTELPRDGLRGVEVAPGVMRGSLRVFANGGLFALVGRFRNTRLGSYRALVTDPERTVVLHYDDGRIVVSPDRPAEFAQALGAPLLTADQVRTDGRDDAGFLKWIILIPVIAGIGIAALVWWGSRPIDVHLDARRLQVDRAFYSVDLPVSRIQSVELREERLPGMRRTNGFGAGSKRRGHFDVEQLGQTRVFTDTSSGPYVLLRTDDGPVILSYEDASQTRALAESLRTQLRQSGDHGG